MIWWATETKNKVSRKGHQMSTLTLSSRDSILLKGLPWSDMEVGAGKGVWCMPAGPGVEGRPTECGAWAPGEAPLLRVPEPQGQPPFSGPRGQCQERSAGDESAELDVTAKDRHFQQWERFATSEGRVYMQVLAPDNEKFQMNNYVNSQTVCDSTKQSFRE